MKCSHRCLFTVFPAASSSRFRIDVDQRQHILRSRCRPWYRTLPRLIISQFRFFWIALHSSPLVTFVAGTDLAIVVHRFRTGGSVFLPTMSSPGGMGELFCRSWRGRPACVVVRIALTKHTPQQPLAVRG